MVNASPCIVCHQKNEGWMEKQNLQRILNLVQPYSDTEIPEHLKRFSPNDIFHVHFSCKYGIYCHDLKQKENEIRVIARQIEPLLLPFIYADTRSTHEVLRLCQGYFPQAYHYIEKTRILLDKIRKQN